MCTWAGSGFWSVHTPGSVTVKASRDCTFYFFANSLELIYDSTTVQRMWNRGVGALVLGNSDLELTIEFDVRGGEKEGEWRRSDLTWFFGSSKNHTCVIISPLPTRVSRRKYSHRDDATPQGCFSGQHIQKLQHRRQHFSSTDIFPRWTPRAIVNRDEYVSLLRSVSCLSVYV